MDPHKDHKAIVDHGIPFCSREGQAFLRLPLFVGGCFGFAIRSLDFRNWFFSEFHNRYVDALHKLIEKKQKAKGEKIIEDPDADEGPPKGSNVIDLMAALKKSLGDQKKSAPAKKPAKKTAQKEPARKRA